MAACREQGRPAEAEILLRGLLQNHAEVEEVAAMFAAVLADLGRDGDAGRRLEEIDLERASLAVCALAAEVAAVLRDPGAAATLQRRLTGHASTLLDFHGSLARHLGLVAHVLGDWHDAASHFDAALEANRAAAAPVLVAHTCFQYSAVLRLRGEEGDWDRAVELLDEAADIYRRLEVDSRAAETEAVLRRSLALCDSAGWPAAGDGDILRRRPGGWELSFEGRSAAVAECAGLDHIARLLGTDARPVHAIDLAGNLTDACLREQLVAECRARLDELAGVEVDEPVTAALARAEQDRIETELASLTAERALPGEGVDRARRLVTVRIRVALERVDRALPELGRHLRRSIRTGTFCAYDPGRPGMP
ncbi:MAG: hypothetical protein M3066_18225 [Actinomycetota bacterium]|nr:hypothetical protein [Actinomycetota bacterium]